MVNRTTKGLLAAVALALCAGLVCAPVVSADKRNLIRFYKINDKGQERRQGMIRGDDASGCHNTRRIKAWRVMVIGFAACEVFAESDCVDASRYVPVWDGDRKRDEDKRNPNGRMSQGSRWILSDSENVSIASFSCTP